MNTNPALDALVSDARATTCAEYAERAGWSLKQQGAYLTGPCPKCGGDDRFSIQTLENKWVCRNCGVGGHDAISLVMCTDSRFENATYKEAFIKVCEVVTGRSAQQEISAEEAARRKAEMERKKQHQAEYAEKRRAEAREAAHRTFKNVCKPAGHVVAEYLECRGLKIDVSRLDKSIRQATRLDYFDDGKKVHSGPAIVCAIQWANNYFGGVHRTWTDVSRPKGKARILSADGTKALDAKKTLGTKGDGAVRLYTPDDARRLVLGEGMETSLTPLAHYPQEQTAYWFALDIGHMAGRAARDQAGKIDKSRPDMADERCVRIPDWCEELILLGEDQGDDEKKAKETRLALARCARRQLARRKAAGGKPLVVKIAWPGIDGDFNDLVMGHNEEKDGGK